MQLLQETSIQSVYGGVSPFAIPQANWATLFALSTKAIADSIGTSLLAEWYGKEPIPAPVKAVSSGVTAALGLYIGFSFFNTFGLKHLPM